MCTFGICIVNVNLVRANEISPCSYSPYLEAGTRHRELFIQDSLCESCPVIEAGGPCVTGLLLPTRIKCFWPTKAVCSPGGSCSMFETTQVLANY
jgi:hypothetical protein